MKIRNAVVLSCLLVGCAGLDARPQGASRPAPAKPAVENQIDPDLKRSVDQLILVLARGQPGDFSGFLSKDGVCIGVDCESMSLEQVKSEIRNRKGCYCELFDSVCLRKELRVLWKKATKEQIEEVLSFRDMFKIATGRDINIQNNGQVHIRFHYKAADNSASSGFRQEEVDFGFVREDSNWKIAAMSAY